MIKYRIHFKQDIPSLDSLGDFVQKRKEKKNLITLIFPNHNRLFLSKSKSI